MFLQLQNKKRKIGVEVANLLQGRRFNCPSFHHLGGSLQCKKVDEYISLMSLKRSSKSTDMHNKERRIGNGTTEEFGRRRFNCLCSHHQGGNS